MIEWREKLSNVESQYACLKIFNPFQSNDMSKKYSHISGQMLFQLS